jgi:hypothetical protein
VQSFSCGVVGGPNLNEIFTVSGLASTSVVFQAHYLKVERASPTAWSTVLENMTGAELNFRLL